MGEPELLRALATLGLSDASCEVVFREAAFGIYMDHVEDGCLYANTALHETFGLTWDEMVGWGWAKVVHEDDVAQLRSEIADFLTHRESTDVRYRVRRGNDGAIRHVHIRIHALYGKDGAKVGALGLTRDVTSEVELDLRKAQSQKLEAIGRLAARVAHDFNDVLASIVMSAELLTYEEISEDAQTNVSTILDATQHATAVTRQLLGLARRHTVGAASCHLDREIRAQFTLIDQVVGERIELRLELGAPDSVVALASQELGQVMLNLCVNARDAMSGTGTIVVTSSDSGGQLELTVRDSGVGIPLDVQQRMFEPFYTTKAEGRGTGIGLSTVSDLVQRAGGTISVSSTLGEGTRLKVLLPTAVALAEVAPPAVDIAPLPRQRILLVDDNAALRQTLAFSLSQRGHDVVMAATIAVARARINETAFDIVITDVLLPDGNGNVVVEMARALNPATPAVYVSGFAGGAADELGLDVRTVFLQKPFRQAELLAVMAAVLTPVLDVATA
ncbi:MAG: response regulator [Nannocystaceae bacterium]|nr:response regulator [Nannocystaceae bacterium]